MNFFVADILHRVRRQVFDEPGGSHRRGVPAVEQDVALAIAADEVAELNGGVDAGPAVGVDGDRIADGDAGVENSDAIVF